MLTIGQRMERSTVEDKIYIGQLIEKTMKTEFGAFFKVLTDGILKATVDESRQYPNVSADKLMGRVETLEAIKDELGIIVQVKNQLLEERLEDQKVKPEDEDE